MLKKLIDNKYWVTNPGNTPKGGVREFINPDWLPWTDWILPNTQFRLLYCNLATGQFTILLKVDKVEPGLPPVESLSHWHAANLQGYIIEGGFYYQNGEDQGYPGYYICEVGGAVHAPFAPDGLLMLLISDGPIVAYGPDGSIESIGDAALHYHLARKNNAVEHTMLVDYVGPRAAALLHEDQAEQKKEAFQP